jgi:hypothetical protein
VVGHVSTGRAGLEPGEQLLPVVLVEVLVRRHRPGVRGYLVVLGDELRSLTAPADVAQEVSLYVRVVVDHPARARSSRLVALSLKRPHRLRVLVPLPAMSATMQEARVDWLRSGSVRELVAGVPARVCVTPALAVGPDMQLPWAAVVPNDVLQIEVVEECGIDEQRHSIVRSGRSGRIADEALTQGARESPVRAGLNRGRT